MNELQEQILSKLIYCYRDIRTDIIPYLLSYEFYESNQIIFDAIVELHNQDLPNSDLAEVDQVTIYWLIKNKGQMDEDLRLHLSKLNTIGLDYTNIYACVGALLDGRYKDKLERIVKDGLKEIQTGSDVQDIEEVKSGLIGDLNEITLRHGTKFMDFEKHKQMYLEHTGGALGFSWGKYLKKVDDLTGGIVKPRVYVIGGLKKSGKTRFIIHTIKELYNQNIKTAFLSLEMPESEVSKLLIASMLGIDDAIITSGKLNPEQRQAINELHINEELVKIDCESGIDIGVVISKIKEYKKYGCEVIFIDYIQRIKHDDKRQAQELEAISIRISDMARKENVAIIIASQLANIAERETPTIGHLKGSGGIGESADTIMLFENIFRKTKKEEDKNKLAIYFEQRHGLSGRQKVYCDLGTCQFKDLFTGDIKKYND